MSATILNIRYRDLEALAASRAAEYKNADPYPSIVFDDFFEESLLRRVCDEFPDLSAEQSLAYRTGNEVKLASIGENLFGAATTQLMHFMNSEPILRFLQVLTGIEETLLPDPYFFGGGYHETKRGGFLKVHSDFNKHRATHLDRRLNILIYLNEDWQESYGGHLELWPRDMSECRRRVLPIFNRVVIFSTTDFSYHGVPDPVDCPDGRSRRSLALYYFSNGRPSEEINAGLEEHTTLFVGRPGNPSDSKVSRTPLSHRFRKALTEITPPVLLRLARKILKNGKEIAH